VNQGKLEVRHGEKQPWNVIHEGKRRKLLDIFAEESARAFGNAKKQELDMDRSTVKSCSMTCKDQNCLK
jgi:hypothetical protein